MLVEILFKIASALCGLLYFVLIATFIYFFPAMIAMQYSLNQDEWVSTALSSMINDEQLGANLKSATSSCEVISNLKFINLPYQLTLYSYVSIIRPGRLSYNCLHLEIVLVF